MPTHQIATVKKVEKENDIVKTFTFDISLPKASPGQFVMAWLPGQEEEKPFSLAGNSPLKLSVGARGPFSKAFCNLKAGNKVWIRGPYGRGFEFPKKAKRMLLVGGGYGFAPLRYLVKEAAKKKISCVAVCGARSKSLLMKPAVLNAERSRAGRRSERICKTIFTTDDGSQGMKGNVLVAMQQLLAKEKFGLVCTCGPEKMMGAVARLAKKHGTPCQLLTERYMKCGIGICGHCCMGEKLVCWDGPMFYFSELEGNAEFEKAWRDKSGRAVPL